MFHVYKIDKVDLVPENPEIVIENEGRLLYDVLVKNVKHGGFFGTTADFMTEDSYEGGWAVLFQNSDDVAFCVNDYIEYDWNDVCTLDDRPMSRHFFIRASYDDKPEEGRRFAFLNQYDKRLTNQEIQEVLNACDDDRTDICYEIGKDDKLHKVEEQC